MALSKEHEYLVAHGWHFIGFRKQGYKVTKYWEHPDYPPPCGSFYQTDALNLQKDQDFLDALIAAHKEKS